MSAFLLIAYTSGDATRTATLLVGDRTAWCLSLPQTMRQIPDQVHVYLPPAVSDVHGTKAADIVSLFHEMYINPV